MCENQEVKFIFVLLASAAFAQDLPPVSAASDYARLHVGVSSPKLLHSVDPEYTPQAIQAGIEGSVVLEAVVTVEGRVAYASVLSPLPAGLDRKALAAVKDWRYSPGVMDAEKIPVLMTIDVLFRLPFKPGEQAAAANQKAVRSLIERISKLSQRSSADIAALQSFAGQGSPAALGLLGQWKIHGIGVPEDRPAGLADLNKAAGANDASSLFFLGNAELDGTLLPINAAHGWLMIRRAAFMGSSAAQQVLAARCEREHNLNQARWYYRLCAARAEPACQYRLGKLMVSGTDGSPNDFAQGIAWLELAKQHQYPAAGALWTDSVAKLSSIQLDWVATVKPHLELRAYKGF